ncbi:MAG: hypothetical protein IE927_03675 [Rhodobacterales bacterium]|nr:hypothetical protein [Rhodobacterales bacterium]
MRAAAALAGLALTACSPQALATDVTRAAARNVVANALGVQYPSAQSELAATCLVQAATDDEAAALARDIGVRPGTVTMDNIRALAARPAAQDCVAARGLPPVAA